MECPFGSNDKCLRLTAAHPRALLNSATITIGPGSRECGSVVNGALVLPLIRHRVPIITSSCIRVSFNANIIGVAPTRSPGSFRINLHRGLPIIGMVASSTGVISSCPGCTKVSHCRTEGTVITSLRTRKTLIQVRSCARGINAYCHYSSAIRPHISGR